MGLWDRLFGRDGEKSKGSEQGHGTSTAAPVGSARDYDRGIQLYDAGRYDEAIVALEAVLSNRRIGPLVERLARFYLAEAYSAAALVNLRQGDSSDATLDNLRTAVSLNPGFADLQFRLGSTYLKRNQVEESIFPLRRALELNPRYIQALLHLALALLRSPSGDPEEAFRLVTRASDAGLTANKADIDAAKTAIEQGDRAAAVEAVTHLTESPENDQTLVLAANALELFQRGDYSDAEAAYRAALAQKPRYADLRNQLGVVLFAQDKEQEALAEFDEALAINPRYAEAHLNRGFVLLRLGRENEGMIAVQTAMELDPDNAVAMVRLKKMFPQL